MIKQSGWQLWWKRESWSSDLKIWTNRDHRRLALIINGGHEDKSLMIWNSGSSSGHGERHATVIQLSMWLRRFDHNGGWMKAPLEHTEYERMKGGNLKVWGVLWRVFFLVAVIGVVGFWCFTIFARLHLALIPCENRKKKIK